MINTNSLLAVAEKRNLKHIPMKPLILLVLLSSCFLNPRAQQVFIHEDATRIWDTPAIFKVPESVKYDPVKKCLLVSNINGAPAEKDGNGFISKVSLNGKVLNLEWITGLDAPKGMGIFGNELFISNLSEIVVADLITGAVLKRYPVKDARFLNDIDIDENGTVYISDMRASVIYRLRNDTVEKWIEGAAIENCNGLHYRKGKLYIGTKDQIVEADTATSLLSVFARNTGPVDGLESTGKGTIDVRRCPRHA